MAKNLTPKRIQRWVKAHPELTAAELRIAKWAELSCTIARKPGINKSPALRKAVVADLQAFADMAKRHLKS